MEILLFIFAIPFMFIFGGIILGLIAELISVFDSGDDY